MFSGLSDSERAALLEQLGRSSGAGAKLEPKQRAAAGPSALHQLEVQVASLQTALTERSAQADELRAAFDAARGQLARVEARAGRAAAAANAAEARAAAAEAQLARSVADVSSLASKLEAAQVRVAELEQGYVSIAAAEAGDAVERRDLLRRSRLGGLVREAAAAGLLDERAGSGGGAGAEAAERGTQAKAAATIAALQRERDALATRASQLAARLAEVAGREGAARGAAAARSARWKRSAVQAEGRLASALQRVKDLGADLKKREAEARQRDKYVAQLERAVLSQNKALQQQRRWMEGAGAAPAATTEAAWSAPRPGTAPAPPPTGPATFASDAGAAGPAMWSGGAAAAGGPESSAFAVAQVLGGCPRPGLGRPAASSTAGGAAARSSGGDAGGNLVPQVWAAPGHAAADVGRRQQEGELQLAQQRSWQRQSHDWPGAEDLSLQDPGAGGASEDGSDGGEAGGASPYSVSRFDVSELRLAQAEAAAPQPAAGPQRDAPRAWAADATEAPPSPGPGPLAAQLSSVEASLLALYVELEAFKSPAAQHRGAAARERDWLGDEGEGELERGSSYGGGRATGARRTRPPSPSLHHMPASSARGGGGGGSHGAVGSLRFVACGSEGEDDDGEVVSSAHGGGGGTAPRASSAGRTSSPRRSGAQVRSASPAGAQQRNASAAGARPRSGGGGAGAEQRRCSSAVADAAGARPASAASACGASGGGGDGGVYGPLPQTRSGPLAGAAASAAGHATTAQVRRLAGPGEPEEEQPRRSLPSHMLNHVLRCARGHAHKAPGFSRGASPKPSPSSRGAGVRAASAAGRGPNRVHAEPEAAGGLAPASPSATAAAAAAAMAAGPAAPSTSPPGLASSSGPRGGVGVGDGLDRILRASPQGPRARDGSTQRAQQQDGAGKPGVSGRSPVPSRSKAGYSAAALESAARRSASAAAALGPSGLREWQPRSPKAPRGDASAASTTRTTRPSPSAQPASPPLSPVSALLASLASPPSASRGEDADDVSGPVDQRLRGREAAAGQGTAGGASGGLVATGHRRGLDSKQRSQPEGNAIAVAALAEKAEGGGGELEAQGGGRHSRRGSSEAVPVVGVAGRDGPPPRDLAGPEENAATEQLSSGPKASGGGGGSSGGAAHATALQRLREQRMQRAPPALAAHTHPTAPLTADRVALAWQGAAADAQPAQPQPQHAPVLCGARSSSSAAPDSLILPLQGSLRGEVRLSPAGQGEAAGASDGVASGDAVGVSAAPAAAQMAAPSGLSLLLELARGGDAGSGSGGASGAAWAAAPAQQQHPAPQPTPAVAAAPAAAPPPLRQEVSLRALRNAMRATSSAGAPEPTSSSGSTAGAPVAVHACEGLDGSGLQARTGSAGSGVGSGIGAGQGWESESAGSSSSASASASARGPASGREDVRQGGGSGVGVSAAGAGTSGRGETAKQHPLMALLGAASADLRLLSSRLTPLVGAEGASSAEHRG